MKLTNEMLQQNALSLGKVVHHFKVNIIWWYVMTPDFPMPYFKCLSSLIKLQGKKKELRPYPHERQNTHDFLEIHPIFWKNTRFLKMHTIF